MLSDVWSRRGRQIGLVCVLGYLGCISFVYVFVSVSMSVMHAGLRFFRGRKTRSEAKRPLSAIGGRKAEYRTLNIINNNKDWLGLQESYKLGFFTLKFV